MPYKVDIVISAENRLDALKGAEGEIQKFGQIATQANQRAAQSFQQAAQQHQQSARQLVQSHQGVSQAAQQASARSIQFNTALAPIGATLKSVTGASEGFSAALVNMVRFAFNPVTIAVGVVAGAVSFLTTRWQEAGRASEQFTSMTADLHKDLALMNTEYRHAIGLIGDLDLAQARFRQNQQSRDLEALQERVARLRSIVGALPEVVKDEKLGFPNLLGLLGFSKDDLHRAEAELAALETFVGARDKAFARNFRADQGRENSEQQIRAADSFTNAIKQQNETLALQIIQLTDGEAAMNDWKQQLLEAHAADLKLNQTQRQSVEDNRKLTLAIRELNEEQARRQELTKFYVASGQEIERREQEEIGYLTKKNQLLAQANQFELEKLRASGASEGVVLQRQLELLRQQREALLLAPKEPGQLLAMEREIELLEIRAQRMSQVTINIGQTVAGALGDAFQGVILGTARLADVGKNLLVALLRDVSQFFTQALIKKAGFENLILSNVNSFIPQLTGAIGAGAANGATSNGGGFLSSIFNLFSGGGSGGLGNIFGGIFGGGGSFGFGSAPAGVSGPAMANGGFFSNPFGGGGFSLGGGALGAGIGLLMSLISGGFSKGQIGGTVGSTLGGVAGSFFGPIGSVIGSVLGKLIGGLFDSVPNPTVTLRAKFSGIFYDALEDVFKPGTVSTRITGSSDISGGAATKVKTQVQSILEGLSKDWTDVLNIFPITVRDSMIPSLERANEILNLLYHRLKFTEGGSNTIADEIKLLETVGGPQRFFFALRQTIGKGIAASLGQAGLGGFDEQIASLFTDLPADVTTKAQALRAPGLKPPKKKEDVEAFTQAIKAFAGITGGLGAVSPAGVGQFLTAADLAKLQDEIGSVLGVTDGKQFTQAVENLQERIKPVLDFLQQSVQQSTEIFGRGLIAALDAATASQANRAFLQSLGQGTKDIIFQGITEAFIASAQFNDLLAPIQQTIRDFTQEAIATGQTPDIDAFRRAILPSIEDISTRAETLAPLIAELQRLGLDVKDSLRALTGVASRPANISINLPSGWTGGESDVRTLAGQLDDILRGQINP